MVGLVVATAVVAGEVVTTARWEQLQYSEFVNTITDAVFNKNDQIQELNKQNIVT